MTYKESQESQESQEAKQLFIDELSTLLYQFVGTENTPETRSKIEQSSIDFVNYWELKEKLNEFKHFEFDWNDNLADPFTDIVINNANEFLKCIRPHAEHISVFPVPIQAIQFEFGINGTYCEAEIHGDKVEVYEVVSISLPNGISIQEKHGKTTIFNDIPEAANYFISVLNGVL